MEKNQNSSPSDFKHGLNHDFADFASSPTYFDAFGVPLEVHAAGSASNCRETTKCNTVVGIR